MHSTQLVNVHFWIATIGIVLYIASMWIAGLMQGLMWRAVNDDGTLTYTFVEALKATRPYYMGRLAGGLAFLIGMLVMAYNVFRTIRGAEPAVETVPVAAPRPAVA
jgi:cytochrome c oxidase cbb3-type subunit 1